MTRSPDPAEPSVGAGLPLADVVAVSAAMAATRSRTAKGDLVADLLRRTAPAQAPLVTAVLAGRLRQGRVGTGWSGLTAGLQVAAPATSSTLVLDEVDTLVERLLASTGAGSVGARHELLTALLSRATAEEQQFLVALLGGELRHGALDGTLAEAVAVAADVEPRLVRRAWMLSGRLDETAGLALGGGRQALAGVGLALMRPVQPMLASPGADVATAVGTGPALVGWKLDGIRVQVHKDGDTVRVWTRTLLEATDRLTDVVEVVRALPADTLVLDGEALTVDGAGRPRPFQDTASRVSLVPDAVVRGAASTPAGDGGAGTGVRVQPFFFDLLHIDGVDLIDRPLAQRWGALRSLAPDHLAPHTMVDGADQAERVLADALAAGHEGVVVKDLDAAYEAGRRGTAWRKVKPVHTLDLLVLAAEWGHGRRTGWLSNLHLGARDPAGGAPIMVGKTFKGLTDELLGWQTNRLQQLATRRTRGAVFVRPELVVEIALDRVQRSTRYPGGVALRFARVLGYRDDELAPGSDKPPEQADTLDAVRALLPG